MPYCSFNITSRREGGRTDFCEPQEPHELFEKVGTLRAGSASMRLGRGFYVSRLPEALWKHRKVRRVVPGHRVAALCCVRRRCD